MVKSSNVIIVSVDTLRTDLHCYGYERIKTPNLDKLAEEGVRFYNAIVEEPITGASHASMLTSMYSHHHGGHANFERSGPIRPEAPIISMILKKKGYVTGGFPSTSNLSNRYSGLGRGFDIYYEEGLPPYRLVPRPPTPEEREARAKTKERPYLRGDRATKAAMRWLEEKYKKRFFLWVHYWDPHPLYDSPPPYNRMYMEEEEEDIDFKDLMSILRQRGPEYEKALRRLHAMYDGAVTYTDKCIGDLMRKVEELGLFDNTIIVIHSDHGEYHGEHGLYGKPGGYLYDTLIRVPLIMRYPDVIPAGMTVESVVQNIDIVPTILDILGVPIPESMDGRSLLPIFTGNKSEIRMEAYTEHPQRVYSIRTKKWKFIMAERVFIYPKRVDKEQLYNLEEDPNETKNIAAQEEKVLKELKEKLLNWIKR